MAQTRSFRWREPVNGSMVELKLVPLSKLERATAQRPLSAGLVNSLKLSVSKGFIIPVVAYKDEEKDKFVVVDGQHRLEALRSLVVGSEDEVMVPVLVVSKEWADMPLHFNREKADNLKDKCHKLYALYHNMLARNPEMSEREALFSAVVDEAYVIPTAFAFVEEGLRSPSLVEPFAKKFLNWLEELPLRAAKDVRREQAKGLAKLEALIYQKAEEAGIRDFNLKKAILTMSMSDLWGRRRLIEDNWDEALEKLIGWIDGKDWSWLGGGRNAA